MRYLSLLTKMSGLIFTIPHRLRTLWCRGVHGDGTAGIPRVSRGHGSECCGNTAGMGMLIAPFPRRPLKREIQSTVTAADSCHCGINDLSWSLTYPTRVETDWLISWCWMAASAQKNQKIFSVIISYNFLYKQISFSIVLHGCSLTSEVYHMKQD